MIEEKHIALAVVLIAVASVGIMAAGDLTGGAVTKPSVSVCSDTDGGTDYYLQGKVTYNGKTYTDTCTSDGVLKEYFCKSGKSSSTPKKCSCNEGACLKPITGKTTLALGTVGVKSYLDFSTLTTSETLFPSADVAISLASKAGLIVTPGTFEISTCKGVLGDAGRDAIGVIPGAKFSAVTSSDCDKLWNPASNKRFMTCGLWSSDPSFYNEKKDVLCVFTAEGQPVKMRFVSKDADYIHFEWEYMNTGKPLKCVENQEGLGAEMLRGESSLVKYKDSCMTGDMTKATCYGDIIGYRVYKCADGCKDSKSCKTSGQPACQDWTCETALNMSLNVVHAYDTNDDGLIGQDEVLNAIAYWGKGKITKDQVCGIVNLWQKNCRFAPSPACLDWTCEVAFAKTGGIAGAILPIYDTNGDSLIGLDEVLNAIAGWSKGLMTKDQVCGIVNMWQKNCKIQTTCKDSDGGVKTYTKGTCTDSSGVPPLVDTCKSASELQEAYCTTYGLTGDIQYCTSTTWVSASCNCKDGACVQNGTAPTCEDSDDGASYYTYGKITYNNNPAGVLAEYDICDGKNLVERICVDAADSSKNFVKYTCQSGCKDGACLKVVEKTSCIPGYLDSYQCAGKWTQRTYRYSDCSEKWVNQKYCSKSCSNGVCL